MNSGAAGIRPTATGDRRRAWRARAAICRSWSAPNTMSSSARDAEPAIGLHLGVELAGAPAGIAQRQQALLRPAALADGAQNFERRGERDVAAHHQRAVLDVIGGMQHEAAPGLDRAAEMDLLAAVRSPAISMPSCCISVGQVTSSNSLLTTSPIAPSALCAQRKITERAKRGSCICGMATRRWPASEVIESSPFSRTKRLAPRAAAGKRRTRNYGACVFGILMLGGWSSSALARPARGAGLALVFDRSGPGAADCRCARCRRRRQRRRSGLQFELRAALEDLLALAGRCGLSAAPRLDAARRISPPPTIAWPAPQRFSVLGLETMGYTDAVVLPITARLDRTRQGAVTQCRARLSHLQRDLRSLSDRAQRSTCRSDAAGEGAQGYAALIAQYQAQVPGKAMRRG